MISYAKDPECFLFVPAGSQAVAITTVRAATECNKYVWILDDNYETKLGMCGFVSQDKKRKAAALNEPQVHSFFHGAVKLARKEKAALATVSAHARPDWSVDVLNGRDGKIRSESSLALMSYSTSGNLIFGACTMWAPKDGLAFLPQLPGPHAGVREDVEVSCRAILHGAKVCRHNHACSQEHAQIFPTT